MKQLHALKPFAKIWNPMHLCFSIIILLTLCVPSVAWSRWPLPSASVQEAGFSPERFQQIDTFCQDMVHSGKYSGLTVLLARDGKLVHWRSLGYRSPAEKIPMETNDIFSIASLTKIITSVAALKLVEQGRITLREPISRHLPEFASMKVFAGGTAEKPVLIDAVRPITLHDLLTHTAGFYSGEQGSNAPVLAGLWRTHQKPVKSLREFSEQLARFPLMSQPGAAWIYGPSTDLVGALVEKVSGIPFDRFLHEQVFHPLQMRETSFSVPEEKQSRHVFMNVRQEDGSLKSERPTARGSEWPSGGGGLRSTPGDYIRFAQMLLNEGSLDGVRILSPKSIQLMRVDHLHGLPKPTKIYPATDGFGYGVEVRTNVPRSQWLGSEGTYGWNGATTAYCSIDPKEKLIAMIWAQHRPNSEFELYERFNNLVYGALVELR
jgi:CubicO group peptidase (beta-lactamase class C family)